jgi:aminopeptidase YwaD
VVQAPAQVVPGDLEALFSDFEIARVTQNLVRLCAAEFTGRRVGSVGHEKAQAWIRQRFEEAGLAAELFPFELGGEVLDVYDRPSIEIVGEDRALRYRTDFAEHPRSAELSGVIEGARWAIIDAVPQGDEFDVLATELHEQGYFGILAPQFPTKDGFLSKRIPARRALPLPVVAIDAELLPGLDGKDLRVALPLRRFRPRTAHVIGRLAGTDETLMDEPLIIGAHYDAVGDDIGGMRLPGAADNASGVAVVLEIARVFARAQRHPRRTLLFVALDGEEIDALGSQAYAQELAARGIRPRVINLDMAARLGEAISVEPGASPAETLEALDQAGEWLEQPLAIASVSSDNRRFAQASFPTVGIALGAAAMHTPADTPDTVDPKAMDAAGRLIAATIWQLAFAESDDGG